MPRKRTDPSVSEPSRSSKRLKEKAIAEEEFVLQMSDAEDYVPEINQEPVELPAPNRVRRPQRLENEVRSVFVGEPVPVAEAKRRWPHRYLQNVPSLSLVHIPFHFVCVFNLLMWSCFVCNVSTLNPISLKCPLGILLFNPLLCCFRSLMFLFSLFFLLYFSTFIFLFKFY